RPWPSCRCCCCCCRCSWRASSGDCRFPARSSPAALLPPSTPSRCRCRSISCCCCVSPRFSRVAPSSSRRSLPSPSSLGGCCSGSSRGRGGRRRCTTSSSFRFGRRLFFDPAGASLPGASMPCSTMTAAVMMMMHSGACWPLSLCRAERCASIG
ncbi:unnamed protein product, partial [Ectocarpus sp. 4 AP-2014]